MLIKFLVSNFKSISEEQELSMIGKDGHNSIVTEVTKCPYLLKSLAVLGPNASGKSSLLEAFSLATGIVFKSAKVEDYINLPYQPFLLDEEYLSKPTMFEFYILIGKILYQYGFSYNSKEIKEEWLYFQDTTAKRVISKTLFTREGSKFDFKDFEELKDKNKQKDWIKATQQNSLFLSTANLLQSVELKPIYDILTKNTAIYLKNDREPFFTINFSQDKDSEKAKIIDFLKSVDLNIENFEIKKEIFDNFEEARKKIKKGTILRPSIKGGYTDGKEVEGLEIITFHKMINSQTFVEFDFDLESDGSKAIFALAGPILKILMVGGLLIVDELDHSIHPYAFAHIINLFNNSNTNPNNAQLIFTTHNSYILNNEILEREQICFIEKDKKTQNTNVFYLSEFKGIREKANFEKLYLKGIFGAVPEIKGYFKDAKKKK